MNRNILYGGAALVGVVSALLLFQGTGPSTEAGPAVGAATSAPEDGAEVPQSARQGPPATAVREGERKTLEGREPRPDKRSEAAVQRDLLLEAGYGKHSREAAPAFQVLALKLKDLGDDALGDEMRVYSQELRQRRTQADVDKAAVLEQERALVQKVRDAGFGDELSAELARVEELMASYEADPGPQAPPSAGATP